MKTRPSWFYKQSAVIPYRTVATKLEILLVTSRRKRRWIIPKGIIDPGTTAVESACKEAYEEAGVKGRSDQRVVGKYEYKKWGGTCVVKVFALEVKSVLGSWPEAELRKRKWMTKKQAVKQVEHPGLSAIIRKFSLG